MEAAVFHVFQGYGWFFGPSIKKSKVIFENSWSGNCS